MGEAIIEPINGTLTIHAHIITYGNSADAELTEYIRFEIESMWNEPEAEVEIKDRIYRVLFRITGAYRPELSELEVLQNTDPRNNYFRIEKFARGNISFVDGLGSNTGYFLLENLYKGSTTAAHEFGHTLGLDHPRNLDIRSRGVPGIMYPRGTLVDPPYQYDPTKPAGVTGGTMHPMHRRVKKDDVLNLKLHRLAYQDNRAIIGWFTNIYHWNHAATAGEEFGPPPVAG
jgi:hypothetical protein